MLVVCEEGRGFLGFQLEINPSSRQSLRQSMCKKIPKDHLQGDERGEKGNH